MNNKENSPFTPGNPVPVELFVGRSGRIEEVTRYIRQSLSGRQENVFLVGDRGIGKSSFAAFLRYLVSSRENILGIHVFLGGVSTLEEMVRHVFDQLLKETKGQPWFESIAGLFGKYVQEISHSSVSGTALPNSTVEIFSDADDDGNIYEGTTTVDSAGNFTWLGSASGPCVTATATDTPGNTSQFSAVPPPDIELSAGSHGYGNVVVGSFCYWNLVISNVGVRNLMVNSVFSTHTDFCITSPTFPQTISAGDSIDMTVFLLLPLPEKKKGV